MKIFKETNLLENSFQNARSKIVASSVPDSITPVEFANSIWKEQLTALLETCASQPLRQRLNVSGPTTKYVGTFVPVDKAMGLNLNPNNQPHNLW